MQALAMHTHLTHLNLAQNCGHAIAGRALAAAMPHWLKMRDLDISKNSWQCTPAMVQGLQLLTALTRLNAMQVMSCTETNSCALPMLTNLQDLDMSEVAHSEAGLQAMLQDLTALTRLRLAGCTPADTIATLLEPVGMCSELQELSLYRFEDACLASLPTAALTKLRALDCTDVCTCCAHPAHIAVCSALVHLTSLKFTTYGVHPAAAAALQCLPKLQELSIKLPLDATWTPEAALFWAATLTALTTLIKLRIPALPAHALLPGSAMRALQKLQELRLDFELDEFADEDQHDAPWLATIIQRLTGITKLYLHTCLAQPEAYISSFMLGPLEEFVQLQYLHIGRADMADCTDRLVSLPQRMPMLKHLHLEGCVVVADQLSQLDLLHLTHLGFVDCMDTIDATVAFAVIEAVALSGECPLETLDLRNALLNQMDGGDFKTCIDRLLAVMERKEGNNMAQNAASKCIWWVRLGRWQVEGLVHSVRASEADLEVWDEFKNEPELNVVREFNVKHAGKRVIEL